VVRAALDRDGLLLQGVALVIALLTFALMLIVDVLVLWLDPRITLEAV
jgi:ABC-type dipeptide/oligopeptide/nickel transport system permease component